MGVLDDAIRDHLDLKRRRGADPAEVERAERDALGPVRRAPVESAEGELELHPPAELDDEYVVVEEHEEHEEHEEWDQPYEAAAAHEPLASEPYAPEPLEPEPYASEPVEAAPLPADPPTRVAEPLAAAPSEPLAPEPPAPPFDEPDEYEDAEPESARGGDLFEHGETAGDATVEYDVEDALDAETKPGEEGEDVLEETPEFLQDTPDHDRLWFEQKPPKDFDFDG
jgi:hypothetical protein